MKPEVAKQIEELGEMTVPELRERYAAVFNEETRSTHKRFLQKRIAWGLQARAEGGLSERARLRAEELANESDLRLLAPKGWTENRPFQPTRKSRAGSRRPRSAPSRSSSTSSAGSLATSISTRSTRRSPSSPWRR